MFVPVVSVPSNTQPLYYFCPQDAVVPGIYNHDQVDFAYLPISFIWEYTRTASLDIHLVFIGFIHEELRSLRRTTQTALTLLEQDEDDCRWSSMSFKSCRIIIKNYY